MTPTAQNQPDMPAVLRRIGEEHKNMAKLLDLLERHVLAFERQGRADYDLLESTVEYFHRFPDACHHPKEDLIFARLKERNAAAAIAVGDLPDEHARLAEKTAALSAVIRDLLKDVPMPRDALGRTASDFVESQRAHMQMEYERFVPAALASLTPEDWQEIDARIDDPEDPVFGSGREDRFDALRTLILEWDEETAGP